MSFQEVNSLRKGGRLNDAFRMAQEDLGCCRDEWSLRAMAWVMYDYVGMFVEEMNLSRLVNAIGYIVQLNIPYSEQVFYDSLCWKVRAFVVKLNSQDYNGLNSLCSAMYNISFPPSEAKSAMLGAFHKFKDNWANYTAFCDWWNFDSFMPKDYDEFKPAGVAQRKIMSLVEKVCIGYSKAVLKANDTARVQAFLPKLEKIASEHPEYQYTTYYMCKLYLALGDKKSAYESVISFVKKKSNDFWVWQTLGETADDADVRFKCYSRALCCDAPNDYLVGIKEKYAEMLISRGLYAEAKAEIDDVYAIRTGNSWRIPNTLQMMLGQPWMQSVARKGDNKELYRRMGEDAEQIIYPDASVISVFIVKINTEKLVCNVVDKEGRTGFFGYRHIKDFTPKVGSIYEVNIRSRSDKGMIDVASVIRQVKEEEWNDNKMFVKGKLIKGNDKNFGMVKYEGNMVFVPPALASGLKHNDNVKGVALKMIDKKKDRLGWTMVLLV